MGDPMAGKYAEQNRIQRQKTIDFINSFKTPCVKCGEHRLYVIDFHHIDNDVKEFGISRMIRGRGRKAIKSESEKCISLCRNCHTEFHYIYGNTPTNPQKDLDEYLKGETA